jgi:hypothetical protein
VTRYFADVGLVERLPEPVFWKSLDDRFGAFGRAYGNNGDDAERSFAAKNATLDLSLAISSQGWAHQHEAYLSWFVRREQVAPASIVDLGCDNGFLACFYARYFPQFVKGFQYETEDLADRIEIWHLGSLLMLHHYSPCGRELLLSFGHKTRDLLRETRALLPPPEVAHVSEHDSPEDFAGGHTRAKLHEQVQTDESCGALDVVAEAG